MGLRHFAMRLLGFNVDTPRTPTANPVQQAYDDAILLVCAIYVGDPWSRRAWEKRIGQTRWAAATRLLRSADILDHKGRFLWQMAPSQEEAEGTLLEIANREWAKLCQHKNYVAPRRWQSRKK